MTIYNKWRFIEGILVLLCTGIVFLLFPLSNSIIYFWIPLILGIALGASIFLVFTRMGWYINIIASVIIAIGDGAFSVPLSLMSSGQIGIIILAISIGFFGNDLGFGISLILESFEKISEKNEKY